MSGQQYGDSSITASYATTATQFSDVGGYAITATLSDPGSRVVELHGGQRGQHADHHAGRADDQLGDAVALTYGTPLSAQQLDASVAGVAGGAAPAD